MSKTKYYFDKDNLEFIPIKRTNLNKLYNLLLFFISSIIFGGFITVLLLNTEFIDTPQELVQSREIKTFFKDSNQPLVLLGAGPGLSDQSEEVIEWLALNSIPFVSSWNGMCFIKSDNKNYYGNIGVYGNRGANFILQSCDKLLVLGSRLDNRQRGSNVDTFAPLADVLVIDVDEEELKKHLNEPRYRIQKFNFNF